MNCQDDSRVKTSTTEIMTIAIISAKYFQNHHERTVCMMRQLGYISGISISRFNRRLHQLVSEYLIILDLLRSLFHHAHIYVIDSMPLPVCKRVHAKRCQVLKGKAYFGRCHAKDEPYFGFKLHLVCTHDGIPVAFDLMPASWHDLIPVQHLTAKLDPQAIVVADKGYVSDLDGNLCDLFGQVKLIPRHRANMIPNSDEHLALIRKHRPIIETVYSQLEKMGVQRLHNRTLIGRFIKLYASLIALICNAFV
jgi:hypothetical protein